MIKNKRKREINNFVDSMRWSEELSHRIYKEWTYIRCVLGAMADMDDFVNNSSSLSIESLSK